MLPRNELITRLKQLGFQPHTPRTSSWKLVLVRTNSIEQTLLVMLSGVGVDLKVFTEPFNLNFDDKGRLYTGGGKFWRFRHNTVEAGVDLNQFILESAVKFIEERIYSDAELGFDRITASSANRRDAEAAKRTETGMGDETRPFDSLAHIELPPSLLLFDLDGTLIASDDLESYRGRRHIGPQGDLYRSRLASAYRALPRLLVGPADLRALRVKFPALRFGVFTRSPRCYAETLLQLSYPDFDWDVLVAFEDVRSTKPSGEGVQLAMQLTGVVDPDRVAVIGDDDSDVMAAYHAGARALLWESGGAKIDWRARERVPDAFVSRPNDLVSILADPIGSLAAFERALHGAQSDRPWRFDRLMHFSDDPAIPRAHIHVGGKMFTANTSLAPRSSRHLVTRSIRQLKDASIFPDAWLDTIREFLGQVSRRIRVQDLLVTAIPAKSERVPRLEMLLKQVADRNGKARQNNSLFDSTVLGFRSGARSHSGEQLDRMDRQRNVRENLYVRSPQAVADRHVVVIDDVVTTGATLLYAHEYLKRAGARTVTCLALTKTVRDS